MFRNKSLALRLIVLFAGVNLLIGAIIFSLYYIFSRDLLLDKVEENARHLTQKNINEIEEVLKTVEKIPLNLASLIEVIDPEENMLLNILETTVKTNDEIFGSAAAFEPYQFLPQTYYYAPYYYKDSSGIAYSNIGTAEYNYFYRDWYQIPKMLDTPVWSEPYYDEGGGNILMTTYSVPFYQTENGVRKLRGIITIDISLEWLHHLVSSITIFESGFAFLISERGTFITHPNPDMQMNRSIFSLAEEYNLPELRQAGRNMVKGKSGFVRLPPLTFDEPSYMYYAPVGANGWSLAVIFPESELYSDLTTLNNIILILGIAAIITLILIIIYIAGRITKPIRIFSGVASEIGAGNLDVQIPELKLGKEMTSLHNAFRRMQQELKRYIEDLKTTTAAKEKIESELRIAHDIQMGMIPKLFPPFPDRDDLDLFAILKPAKEVGGDLYDFFFIDDEHLCFAVGDVADKGVPASLLMAVTRTLLRSKAHSGMKTDDLVKEMNANLKKDNPSQLFVTFLLCVLNIKNGEITFTNAGHNRPYILKKNGDLEYIKITHGTPLGTWLDMPYKSDTLKLNPGDKFFLYSDGVTEAMNAIKELYGDDRFENKIKTLTRAKVKECTETILTDIQTFTAGAEQSDDITIFVLQWNG